jgi:hypothetical protein
MLEASLEDLSAIWVLLEYFGLYFKDSAYGHPSFLADQIAREAVTHGIPSNDDGFDIDFRLWLTRPHVVIPSTSGIYVMLEASGLYYRYKSFGVSYSSQHIDAEDLGIVVLRDYYGPSVSRGTRQVSGCLNSSGAQTLIDGLSISIQYDYNESVNHTKFAVRIPFSRQFDRTTTHGIESSDTDVKPYQCQAPLVCKPLASPSRQMRKKFTAYVSCYEYMKLAADVLTAFVGPKQVDDPAVDTTKKILFSVVAHVEGAEFIISDPLMGMHRPLLSISLPSLWITLSQLESVSTNTDRRNDLIKSGGSHTSHHDLSCNNDLQASVEVSMFIDYFKLGKTRNWEVSYCEKRNSLLFKLSHLCFLSLCIATTRTFSMLDIVRKL